MITAAPIKSTCPADGVEAANHFLNPWFSRCDGIIELRHAIGEWDKTGTYHLSDMKIEWFTLDTLANMAKRAVSLSDGGREVYYGVNTRKSRKGTKGNVNMLPGFYADMDFKSFPDGGIGALEKLNKFTPQPTQLVHTGGGFHIYWKADTPRFPTPGTRRALRELVINPLQADPGATDLARIFRIPGVWSHKHGLPVRLLRCDCDS